MSFNLLGFILFIDLLSWPGSHGKTQRELCTQGLIETLGSMVIFDENQAVSDVNKYKFLYPIYAKIINFLVIRHHFDYFYVNEWLKNPSKSIKMVCEHANFTVFGITALYLPLFRPNQLFLINFYAQGGEYQTRFRQSVSA